MSQKIPVDGFEWVKNLSKFNKGFLKNYGENSDKGYILEVDVKYPKNLRKLHIDLSFLPGRMEINKWEKLVCTVYNKKKTMLFT